MPCRERISIAFDKHKLAIFVFIPALGCAAFDSPAPYSSPIAGPDPSSLIAFAVPCLTIIAVLLVAMLAAGEKSTSTPAAEPTPGEAALLAELRELKKRRILEKGGAA